MDEAALRAAYPRAADAVVGHERHISPLTWALIRAGAAARGHGPVETARGLRLLADATAAHFPDGEIAAMRPQMDHPDFLRYVSAKLGAV